MFTYVGQHKFVTEEAHGRVPRQEGMGWLWTDYNQNRNVYVRPLGKGKYQLVIFVNNTRTSNEETTKAKIQTYTVNNLGFAIHDNMFDAMDKSIR